MPLLDITTSPFLQEVLTGLLEGEIVKKHKGKKGETVSDIAQGALIGITGTMIGALITGIISYIIAKQQINASREALNQQLKYKEQETLIDNLIKAREKVLIPLREAVSSSLVLADNALVLTVQMQEANKKPDKKELSEAIQRWEEAFHKAREADTGLAKLRYQISASHLGKIIDEVIMSGEREDINIAELVIRAHELKGWDIDISNKARSITDGLKVIRKRIFDKLLPVNRRIEELLSGEPSV